MPTQAIAGRSGQFTLTTGTVTDPQTAVAELIDWKVTVTRPNIDVTSNNSSGWHERIIGVGDWRGAISFIHGSTSVGNTTVRNALLNGLPIQCQFRPSSSGLIAWKG